MSRLILIYAVTNYYSQSWRLTHYILVDSSSVIGWMSPFVILGVSGLFGRFYSIFDGMSYWQSVQTLIRRHIMWRLIWVCTVCQRTPFSVSSLQRVKWQRVLKCMDLRIYKGNNFNRKVFYFLSGVITLLW